VIERKVFLCAFCGQRGRLTGGCEGHRRPEIRKIQTVLSGGPRDEVFA
jgi:hypothetical protein